MFCWVFRGFLALAKLRPFQTFAKLVVQVAHFTQFHKHLLGDESVELSEATDFGEFSPLNSGTVPDFGVPVATINCSGFNLLFWFQQRSKNFFKTSWNIHDSNLQNSATIFFFQKAICIKQQLSPLSRYPFFYTLLQQVRLEDLAHSPRCVPCPIVWAALEDHQRSEWNQSKQEGWEDWMVENWHKTVASEVRWTHGTFVKTSLSQGLQHSVSFSIIFCLDTFLSNDNTLSTWRHQTAKTRTILVDTRLIDTPESFRLSDINPRLFAVWS